MSEEQDFEVIFIVEVDEASGGYAATCSRWGIYTQGENLDDLRQMVREATALRFEGEPEQPKQIRLHFIRDEVIAA